MSKIYVVTCGYDYNEDHGEVIKTFWDKDEAEEFLEDFERYQFGIKRLDYPDLWEIDHPWPEFLGCVTTGIMEIELPEEKRE